MIEHVGAAATHTWNYHVEFQIIQHLNRYLLLQLPRVCHGGYWISRLSRELEVLTVPNHRMFIV